VSENQRDATAWVELRERARCSGLELSEEDVRDLLPYHIQHQRWLETLQRVLSNEEEPATVFSAAGAHYVRE
jgi:hypothetical protein